MRTVTIPGGTACLRENTEIKIRHRRLIETAAVAAAQIMAKIDPEKVKAGLLDMAALDVTRQEADRLYEVQDATIVAVLDSWTLPMPVPDMDTIGDLDPDVYQALADASKDIGAQVAARVDFDPTDPHSPGFHETPTLRSSGSESGSSADPAQTNPDTSPQTPATTGTSTGTGPSSPA